MKSLLFAALLAALAGPALAQSPEEAAVVVTATRFPENRLEAPIGMTVITAREIAESSAKTLPDLLERETGIVTRDNTGSPDRQIDMRGFGITGDQNTLVLLDGQRLNENELVSVAWSSIPIDSIERIEIMRGSGSVLYGSGATGGTINIITRAPRKAASGVTAGASAGSYGTQEFRGGFVLAGEQLALTLNANDYASDNYRVNNRNQQRNVEGELRRFDSGGYVAFKFGLDQQQLRLPGARTAAQLESDPKGATTPDDYSDRDGERAALALSRDLGFGDLAAELGYRNNTRTSFLKDYFSGLFNTYTETRRRVWSFTPRLRIPYEGLGNRHILVLGIDADDWDYDSRKATSADALEDPDAHVLATQKNAAIYAQHNSEIGEKTKLTLGARVQRVTTAANDTESVQASASGSKTSRPTAWEIGLRQKLTRDTAAYARVGRSFRIATFDEVYSQFGGMNFDPLVALLEPQTSRDREIGLEYRVRDLRLRGSAFWMDLENEIYFFFPAFSNINLPPTRRKGIELEVVGRVNPTLSFFANATATQARFVGGDIQGVDVSGNTIPLVPRNTANAGSSWYLRANTALSGTVRFVGRQYYDNDQTNAFSLMPSYATVDLRLSHLAEGSVRLSATLNNILDRHYYSYGIRNSAATSFNAYPQAGRTILLSVDTRF